MNYRFRSHYFLCTMGGLLYALGYPTKFATNGIFPLSIIGTFLLIKTFHNYAFEKKLSLSETIWGYLLFCFTTNLFGFYWISYTLKEFGNILAPMNYIVSTLYSLVIFPQFTALLIILIIYKRFREIYLTEHYYSPIKLTPSTTIILAAVATLMEYLIPQQFPAHVGHSWMSTLPYLGLGPIFGVSIFSFMSYWLIYSIIYFFNTKKLNILFSISFIIFLGLNISLPKIWSINNNNVSSKELNIRIVQANIGNFLKLQSESGNGSAVNQVVEKYENLSLKKDRENQKIDLIIWPETAYPYPLFTDQMKNLPEFVPQVFSSIGKATEAEILFGGYGRNINAADPFFEGEYNSTFLMSNNGLLKDYYNKHFLLPFGETLPVGKFKKNLSQYIQNISYFAAGDKFTLFKLKNELTFITPVCYEILFSSFIRDYFNSSEQKPDIIINLTNDSWYGDTTEPFQHLFLAKWRAVEFNTPVIRATNTGITSVIYPDGTESNRIKSGEEKTLDIALTIADTKKTIFQRFGLLTMFALWLILVLFQYLLSAIFPSRKRESFL